MPTRKAVLLRLPQMLLEELRLWARQEVRSLNAHIAYLLREAVRMKDQDVHLSDHETRGF